MHTDLAIFSFPVCYIYAEIYVFSAIFVNMHRDARCVPPGSKSWRRYCRIQRSDVATPLVTLAYVRTAQKPVASLSCWRPGSRVTALVEDHPGFYRLRRVIPLTWHTGQGQAASLRAPVTAVVNN